MGESKVIDVVRRLLETLGDVCFPVCDNLNDTIINMMPKTFLFHDSSASQEIHVVGVHTQACRQMSIVAHIGGK